MLNLFTNLHIYINPVYLFAYQDGKKILQIRSGLAQDSYGQLNISQDDNLLIYKDFINNGIQFSFEELSLFLGKCLKKINSKLNILTYTLKYVNLHLTLPSNFSEVEIDAIMDVFQGFGFINIKLIPAPVLGALKIIKLQDKQNINQTFSLLHIDYNSCYFSVFNKKEFIFIKLLNFKAEMYLNNLATKILAEYNLIVDNKELWNLITQDSEKHFLLGIDKITKLPRNIELNTNFILDLINETNKVLHEQLQELLKSKEYKTVYKSLQNTYITTPISKQLWLQDFLPSELNVLNTFHTQSHSLSNIISSKLIKSWEYLCVN